MYDFYEVAAQHYADSDTETIRRAITETERLAARASGGEMFHYKRLATIQRKALQRARVKQLLHH